MTITLPDRMKESLEELAAAEGFSHVDAYLLFLVYEAQAIAARTEDDDGEPEDVPEPPAGASYVVTSREDLEAKLTEGMNSGPPIRVTPEFWRDRRKALAERVSLLQRGMP